MIQRLLEVFVLKVKALPLFLMRCNEISCHKEYFFQRPQRHCSPQGKKKPIQIPLCSTETMTDYGSSVSIIIDEHDIPFITFSLCAVCPQGNQSDPSCSHSLIPSPHSPSLPPVNQEILSTSLSQENPCVPMGGLPFS